MAIKILLVEDQQLVREGLKGLLALSDEILIVGESSDGAEAVQWLAGCEAERMPDIILSDMRMPRLDGLGLIRALAARAWSIPVVLLTTFDDAQAFDEAVRAGARGFLLKAISSDTLLQALRDVQAGGTALRPSLTTRMERHGEHLAFTAARPARPAVAEGTAGAAPGRQRPQQHRDRRPAGQQRRRDQEPLLGDLLEDGRARPHAGGPAGYRSRLDLSPRCKNPEIAVAARPGRAGQAGVLVLRLHQVLAMAAAGHPLLEHLVQRLLARGQVLAGKPHPVARRAQALAQAGQDLALMAEQVAPGQFLGMAPG